VCANRLLAQKCIVGCDDEGGVQKQNKKLDLHFRPQNRRALLLGILIFQAAVLVAGEFLVDAWIRNEFVLSQLAADRLFVFRISVAFCVFMLTGLTLFLASKRYRDTLENANDELNREIARQVKDGLSKRNALIFGLAKLADYRDTDTGAHLERIGLYARVIADSLSTKYPEIDMKWIDRIVLASSLHDIGKVGIPDSILLKPGKLTPQERHIMEKHALIGADTLLAIRSKLGSDEFIDMGIEIALQHHEKWDGTGYPFGLKGEDISLAARIVALADFYDAVTSKRVYKDAMSHQESADLIRKLKGSHFAPDVADAFFENEGEFNTIRDHNQQNDHTSIELMNLEGIARDFIDEQAQIRYAA
jgi:HD-GYP domain-containing protein (c-di-GMP phosphodiesterase class II)